MSDYLSSLVARNLSPQEGILPRPRARFEPASPMSDELAQAEVNREGAPQAIAASTIHSAVPTQLPDQSPAWTPLAPAPIALAPTQPDPVVDSPVFEPYRGRLDPPSNPQSIAAAKVDRDQVSLSPPGPAAEVFQSSPAPAALQPAQPQAQVREVVLERIVERAIVPAIQPAAAPPGPDPQRPAPLASITPASEPAVQPLRPVVPPLPDLAAQNAPPPAPTIQVTIGRIEVRATQPVKPTRRAAPQSKIMGLDEYLRSRADGDRR